MAGMNLFASLSKPLPPPSSSSYDHIPSSSSTTSPQSSSTTSAIAAISVPQVLPTSTTIISTSNEGVIHDKHYGISLQKHNNTPLGPPSASTVTSSALKSLQGQISSLFSHPIQHQFPISHHIYSSFPSPTMIYSSNRPSISSTIDSPRLPSPYSSLNQTNIAYQTQDTKDKTTSLTLMDNELKAIKQEVAILKDQFNKQMLQLLDVARNGTNYSIPILQLVDMLDIPLRCVAPNPISTTSPSTLISSTRLSSSSIISPTHGNDDDPHTVSHLEPEYKMVNINSSGNNKRLFRKATKHRSASSKYRGVYFNKQTNTWRARIWFGGTSENIGSFETEEEAAKAFDKRAIELRGIRTAVNFPDSYTCKDIPTDSNSSLSSKHPSGSQSRSTFSDEDDENSINQEDDEDDEDNNDHEGVDRISKKAKITINNNKINGV